MNAADADGSAMAASPGAGPGAGEMLQRALVAAIGAAGTPAFAAPPVRAAVPCAVVDPPLLTARDAHGCTGREGRVMVTLHDEGETPDRPWRLLASVEAAIGATMPDLPGGWRLVAAQIGTGRMRRADGLRWTATVEMRVRLYRLD